MKMYLEKVESMLPTTFWLIVTYRCNDRCGGCYAAAECFPAQRPLPKPDDDMPLAYAKDVMAELKDCGVDNCLLIGGEPTLHAYLLELIEYGTSLGLKMKLVTNGRRLADRSYVERLKQAGLVHTSVSIEASTADLHDRITGTRGFGQRIAGLQNLVDVGVSNNSILTLTVQNAEEVVPVAQLVHRMGVKNVLYNFSLPTVSENGGVDGRFSLDPRTGATIIVSAYRRLKELRIPFTFFATIPLCLIDEDTREAMIADRTIARSYHCHIFYGTGAAFEPNGNVLPCTHFAGTPLFNAMDKQKHFAYRGKFAREWEGGVHKDFVEASWKYPSPKCRSCQLWGICLGGCPFQWMHFDPKQYITGLGREVISDGRDQPS